mmetsp:Transcript_126213/g.229114  ORF Transcript_126213/g.229114 Transcript_126213/m.229114 type:complete len:84 (+) Transcript_126213:131-382(+)
MGCTEKAGACVEHRQRSKWMAAPTQNVRVILQVALGICKFAEGFGISGQTDPCSQMAHKYKWKPVELVPVIRIIKQQICRCSS